MMVMSAVGDRIGSFISLLASTAVSLLISIPLIRRAKTSGSQLKDSVREMGEMKGRESRIASVFAEDSNFDFAKVKRIAYACDAGLG